MNHPCEDYDDDDYDEPWDYDDPLGAARGCMFAMLIMTIFYTVMVGLITSPIWIPLVK
jgi:hypothetical protein